VQSTDAEGETEGSGLTYSLTGGADQALFSIGGNTGVLTFSAAPDFESPADADTNNDYEVQVTVTDSGSLTDVQDITVNVTDVNESPSITSDGGGPTAAVNAAENQTAVTDVQSSDPEGETEGSGLTYSLTGGADQALFSIDANTGVLTFTAAPDFESPGDDGANNVYDVQITVTDSGSLTDIQDLAVTVTDENDAPTITGTVAGQNVDDNATVDPFSGVTIDDEDGDTLDVTVTLSAGANGVLTNLGGFADLGGGVYQLTAALPAAATTEIQALTFDPTENQAEVVSTVSTTFTIDVEDGTAPTVSDNTTDVTATSINDGPGATNTTQTIAYTEGDASVALDPDIVVTDPDLNESITATLTLADTATGALTSNDGATYTPGTGIWTITSSLAAVNTALANVAFEPVSTNQTDTTVSVNIADGGEDGAAAATGTLTLDVTPLPRDFGDAPTGGSAGAPPDTYPTLIGDDGARHIIAGPRLGGVDPETEGLAHADALGDDNDGTDDEDGVSFVATLSVSTAQATTASVSVDLQNADGSGNVLDGWIDFSRDGD